MHRRSSWLWAGLWFLAACGGSEFSSQTTGAGGSGDSTGAAGDATSTGAAGVGTSEVATSTVATGGTGGGSNAGGATGVTTGSQGGAIGTGGAIGGSAGASNGDSSPGLDGARDASRDAGPNCPALSADVQQKLAAAQACTPDDPSQCQAEVEGLCCTVLVAVKDSIPTHNYLNALTAFRMSGCMYGCTATPCLIGPGTCKDTGGTMGNKTCQR